MIPDTFSDADRKIARECLDAAVNGPFFPDWEFQTLFGLSRQQMADLSIAWPDVDLRDQDARLALNNAVGNLLGYPHGQDHRWSEFLSLTPDELSLWWERWRPHLGVERQE